MSDLSTLRPLLPTPTVPFNSQSTDTFDTIFLNLLDEILFSISIAYMRKLLSDKCKILPNSSDLLIYISHNICVSLQLIIPQSSMHKSLFFREYYFLHCLFPPENSPVEKFPFRVTCRYIVLVLLAINDVSYFLLVW